MKKVTLISFFVLLLGSASFSQSQGLQLQTADSTIIKNLINEINELKSGSDRNSSSIKTILAGRVLNDKNQYTILKGNITDGIGAYEMLHEKVLVFIAKSSSDKLDAFIKDLNNPQSNKLGFKLEDEIVKVVNARIAPKEKKVAKKVIENISGITASPIINSITAIVPALSITNSVIGLLRGSSIVKDKIDQNAINAFEADLNKFIKYYEILNEANTGLSYNLKNSDQSLSILQQKISDGVAFQAKTLGFSIPTKSNNEELSTYLISVFAVFNKNTVLKKLTDIEQANTQNGVINYSNILDGVNGGSLKDANNHLDDLSDLINAFSIYHDDYFNLSSFYYSKVIEALTVAKNNGVANASTIDTQLNNFTKLTTEANNSLKAAINLPGLLNAKQSIKFSVKIL